MADLFLNIIFNMTGWILISLCRNIYRCDFYVLGHYHVGKVCLYIFFQTNMWTFLMDEESWVCVLVSFVDAMESGKMWPSFQRPFQQDLISA